ncbi:MAG: CAP domain-containing protein [Candidatus Nomurabacteria bacterium]
MKYTNQVIFIIILIALVYVIGTDYKSIYSKTLSFIQGKSGITSIQSKMNDAINSVNGTNNSSNIDTTKNAVVPGALVVSDNYLTSNTKNIKLTKEKVIEITNKERSLNGNLPPLKENSKLDFSAEKKLQDMFTKGYFEHVSPDGVGVADLGTQVGYEYIIIGENLALGNFKDDQSLVDAWMASPGHRANILNNKYSDIGVSIGKGTYKGESVWMAVQHFALPKSACPKIDEVLRGMIDIEQKNMKQMEVELGSRKVMIDSGAISGGATTMGQINDYNVLVSEYNKLILDIKNKTNIYNAEVRDFNNCIASVN